MMGAFAVLTLLSVIIKVLYYWNINLSVAVGSEDEAEQFAHLSPEQAKAKLELIFKKMDANSDGALDIPELEKWIIQSFTWVEM